MSDHRMSDYPEKGTIMAPRIRIAQLTDAAAIQAIYAPYCNSSHVSFEIVAPSVEQMQQRISRIAVGYPWLVGEANGEILGYVYASQHRERAAYGWGADVAVYVAASRQRRGVGKTLYGALFSILREQGYFKAFAGVSLPNPASVGLHESLGFRPAGIFRGDGYKNGQWLDVGWWQLELQSERHDPPEPVPFSAIRDNETVQAILAEAQRLSTI